VLALMKNLLNLKEISSHEMNETLKRFYNE